MKRKKTVTAVVIGAGNRGKDVYGSYAIRHPEELAFVAIAEPNLIRKKQFAEAHNIPSSYQFDSWEKLLDESVGKIANTAFITTQDQMHAQPAIKAMALGYDVLLEKPMATNLEDCFLLVKKAEECNCQLRIAHVLRYNNFFKTIYNIVKSGRLGKIITIDHRENVSYYHMTHSFVRGNWRREDNSPMILAKSCHDLDILYWLVGAPATQISSFGSLMHFRPENAPERVPKRCMDGCPIADTCKYYAPRIYIDIIPFLQIYSKIGNRKSRFFLKLLLHHPRIFMILKRFSGQLQRLNEYDGWPVSTITDDLSFKGKMDALKTGPYGRCVYYCDNDVVDHQVTIIEFSNQVTATFTMHGFSHIEGRTIRIDGTDGTLIGGSLWFKGDNLVFYNHLKGTEEVIIDTKAKPEQEGNHAGGDVGLLQSFISSFQDGYQEEPLTNAKDSLESHIMAFAAERSRLFKQVVQMEEFRRKEKNYVD